MADLATRSLDTDATDLGMKNNWQNGSSGKRAVHPHFSSPCTYCSHTAGPIVLHSTAGVYCSTNNGQ